ncbi:alcohol dehydrogenase catalytic domain-containing protein [Streptomonospora sediminis]
MLVQEIRFTDIGRVAVGEVEEEPNPRAGELVIAPAFAGICGSDLHLLDGRHPFVRPPVVTGHEVAGVVTAVGAGVTGRTAGDRVLLNPLVSCGTCAACAAGLLNHCEHAQVLGYKRPGAARTRVVVPAAQTHPLPTGLPLDAAVLAEPLAAAWHAVGRAGAQPGALEDVLVIGGGPIGLCVAAAARAAGAGRITLVEPMPAKRELARTLGADAVPEPGTAPVEPGTCSAAFDCVVVPATVRTAVDATRPGGRVVTVGVPHDDTWQLPLPRMQRFEIDLVGSGMYTPTDVDAAIAAIAGGRIDPRPLISARYPLADAPQAYTAAASPETVKVLIRIGG